MKKSHSSNNTADKGLMNTNNNGSIQAVSRQDGKGEFKPQTDHYFEPVKHLLSVGRR